MYKDLEQRKAYQKAYQKVYHQTRKHDPIYKQKQKEKAARRYKKNSELLTQYKKLHPCQCGESDPVCLDFHHIDGDKEIELSKAAIKWGWSDPRLISELKKCIVLCSNCHRKLHHSKEAQGSEALCKVCKIHL